MQSLLDRTRGNQETPVPDRRLHRFKVEVLDRRRANQRLNLRVDRRVERVLEPFLGAAGETATTGVVNFASQICSFTSSNC